MRAGLANKEPLRQEDWAENNIYEQRRKLNEGKPKFVLHDGPPFANGPAHIGHALNKVTKDFIVRYRSMAGFDTPFVHGWDTHGLPIEQALTNQGVDRKKMSIVDYRKMAEEYALGQIDIQREAFKRLGVTGEIDNPYITLQPEYEAAQIRVFGKMAENGYLYQGKKPVYWSPSSESTLAEAEIEYDECGLLPGVLPGLRGNGGAVSLCVRLRGHPSGFRRRGGRCGPGGVQEVM